MSHSEAYSTDIARLYKNWERKKESLEKYEQSGKGNREYILKEKAFLISMKKSLDTIRGYIEEQDLSIAQRIQERQKLEAERELLIVICRIHGIAHYELKKYLGMGIEGFARYVNMLKEKPEDVVQILPYYWREIYFTYDFEKRYYTKKEAASR